MTCLALDDEPLALQLLQHYIDRSPALDPQGYFSDPDAARQRLQEDHIDLLFLDIQMPDITGLAFFQGLSRQASGPMVVFTTAYSEFAVEGFNLDAVDYLLKPFDFERFTKAVKKAAEYLDFLKNRQDRANPQSLFVKSGYSVQQIHFDQIVYLEGYDDYVKIHLEGNPRPVMTLDSLKNLLDKLPAGKFLRVHRSYVVAKDNILSLRRGKIQLKDNREVPVGEKFAPDVKMMIGSK